MKILLTGANGYIGMRLLPLLLDEGHEVVCAVRDAKRLSVSNTQRMQIEVVEIDFLNEPSVGVLPEDIDAGSFDNCGPVSFELSDDTFDCNDILNDSLIIVLISSTVC